MTVFWYGALWSKTLWCQQACSCDTVLHIQECFSCLRSGDRAASDTVASALDDLSKETGLEWSGGEFFLVRQKFPIPRQVVLETHCQIITQTIGTDDGQCFYQETLEDGMSISLFSLGHRREQASYVVCHMQLLNGINRTRTSEPSGLKNQMKGQIRRDSLHNTNLIYNISF